MDRVDGVIQERHGRVLVVTIDRPDVRNAVDRPTADALESVFRAFDADDELSAAVLTGADGQFCSGADLSAVASEPERTNRVEPGPRGPLGPTRLLLDKPVLAAIEGYAVGGGLELALWCDLRVAAADAVLGAFSRRWGVPLVDGGTVRLPRLIGASRALDLILTGRPVPAAEAQEIGLVNRLAAPGEALREALSLAEQLCRFPQATMRSDRRSVYESAGLPIEDALAREHELGSSAIRDGHAQAGAQRFVDGAGRRGSFEEIVPE
jgi:enoyl-CoA hydratase